MEGLEEKLGAMLNDPDTMQKIMSMAQALGVQQGEQPPQPSATLPDMDLSMLKKLSGLAGQGSIDRDQQNLLRALSPYLSRQRITKLENAMRAAKMARFAAAAFAGKSMQGR